MADDRDDSQRTEEPTPKKLEDARKRGQIVSSREVNHWFMILASTLALAVLLPSAMSGIGQALYRFIEMPDLIVGAPNGIAVALRASMVEVGMALLPIVVVFIVGAFAGAVIPSGIVVSAERIKPKFEKISPMAGVKRLFSLKAIAEFVKGLIKIAIVGTAATLVLWPALADLERLPTLPLGDLMGDIQALAVRLFVAVLAVMTVVAALDVLYQRFDFMKQMRMSRQEIKDEFKQSDGDPMIKGRLRQLRAERARRRMMAAVPNADVVITNPTHFAVALEYKPETMAAPRLIAKGADEVAARIRETAKQHDVPIVENPPLARALFAAVDIDKEVPTEHYKAVAEVIGYVFRLKGRAAAE